MTINDVYITLTASILPNEPVSNDDIEDILGKVDGRPSRVKRIILRQNGIKQRYYVLDPETRKPVYTNAQLTALAIRRLSSDPGVIDDIGCLSCGTTMADQLAPNHAVMVHGELKTPPCETIATAGICTSGMAALKYAWLSVRCGEHKKAITTGSEVASVMLRAEKYSSQDLYSPEELEQNPELCFEKDFLRWMLSDGAGAFLLESENVARSDQTVVKIEWIRIISFANEMETCMYALAEKQADGSLRGWTCFDKMDLMEKSILTIQQDVKLLNEHIVQTTLVRALKKTVEQTGLKSDDIDFFLPHISSMYFYGKVEQALNDMGFPIPQHKWFTNLEMKGNTGSAAIYIMLDELLKSGRVKRGDRILCFVPESGRFSSSFMLLSAI